MKNTKWYILSITIGFTLTSLAQSSSVLDRYVATGLENNQQFLQQQLMVKQFTVDQPLKNSSKQDWMIQN